MSITKESLSNLDNDELYLLLTLVRNEMRERTERDAPGVVREVLASVLAGNYYVEQVDVVVFGTSHWDGGYHYTGDAELTLAGGKKIRLDLTDRDNLDILLTDLTDREVSESGPLDDRNAVRIDLRTGRVRHY